jgi:hypothetical protein
MSQFDWPIAKKKLKLWGLPKIDNSMERSSASPFALWAKHMGLTEGAIGNTFGEHIGNIMRI